MGSYLKAHQDYIFNKLVPSTIKQEIKSDIQPEKQESESELYVVVSNILEEVYGSVNLVKYKEIENIKFVASQGNLVFEITKSPHTVNADRLSIALRNNYIMEVIYLVPDRVLTNNFKITYRYIAEYVKIIQQKNKTDLVRWINQFRNKAEVEYERTKKSSFAQSQKR